MKFLNIKTKIVEAAVTFAEEGKWPTKKVY